MKKLSNTDPVETGRPGRLLNVLCTFNLRPASTGMNQFVLKELKCETLSRFYMNSFCLVEREDEIFVEKYFPLLVFYSYLNK